MFKSTDGYDLDREEAAEMAGQFKPMGVKRALVCAHHVQPPVHSALRAEALLRLRRQDLRRVKAGAIERMQLPDVHKDILETIRQAQLPPGTPRRQALPPFAPRSRRVSRSAARR